MAAALSIILLHVLAWYWYTLGNQLPIGLLTIRCLTEWSMPFFFAISGYLHGRAGEKAANRSWLWRRFLRLLPVLVVWDAIYRVIYLAQGLPYGGKSLLKDLLFGSASHLWYLPVLLQCTIIVWLVTHRGHTHARNLRLLVLSSGVLCAVFCVAITATPYGSLAYYVLYRLPLYWLFFYALGCLLGQQTESVRSTIMPLALGLPGVALLIASAFLGYPLDRFGAFTYFVGGALAGIAATLVSTSRRGRPNLTISSLANAAFGIYLAHIAVLTVVLPVLFPLGPTNVALNALLSFCVVAFITFSIAVAAGYWRPTRLAFGYPGTPSSPPPPRSGEPGAQSRRRRRVAVFSIRSRRS